LFDLLLGRFVRIVAMDYASEQEMEIEALEAILMDELESNL